ncbi:protein kinase family protein [Nocardia sp. NPDC057353]|uniref:protein kinase family protein n=1 Tax=Nocardia sp. NPDC057353 TaxID=3346104 RepID=UPI00362D4A84
MMDSVRPHAYSAASAALASHGNRALRDLVDAATPVGTGIGGRSALLEVAGIPVFVKRVPLTDVEAQVRSTANLFDLPTFCHYGAGLIGSPGFGAWRELAVHTMATDWVLAGEYAGFPLLYHWRVLPDTTPLPEELADIDRAVAYWDDRPQVRRRIEALRDSAASLTLFLEYIPQNLHEWLGARIATDGRACVMAERELAAGAAFLNSRGLLHFDAHFENILTDGHRLYFADYGLALSAGFDLSPAETAFFERNRSYDRAYIASYLANWLVTAVYQPQREDHAALVRAFAAGKSPEGIPEETAAVLLRNAPVAATLSQFFRAFRQDSRETPYPDGEIRRLLPDRPFRGM